MHALYKLALRMLKPNKNGIRPCCVDPTLHVGRIMRGGLSPASKAHLAWLGHGKAASCMRVVATRYRAMLVTDVSENGSTCVCVVCKTNMGKVPLGLRMLVCAGCGAECHRDVKAAFVMPQLCFAELAVKELAGKAGRLSDVARAAVVRKLGWGQDDAPRLPRFAKRDAPADAEAPGAAKQAR